jgi:Na+(H+)/acetate symporter ActP
MPENIQIGAFVVGIVLGLVALLGGGFKIFGAEVPKVGWIVRSIALPVGVIFLYFGFAGVPSFAPSLPPDQQKQYDLAMASAEWSRNNNRPRQAILYYKEARKISPNPDIDSAIETLQRKIDTQ